MAINNDSSLPREDLVFGRNPVFELVKTGAEIDKILVAKEIRSDKIAFILSKARDRKIVVREVPQQKLDYLCGGGNHQGVAAMLPARTYCSVEDILQYAKEKSQAPFVIVCDGIEDPHNLGAIIRTAEAAGAHGLIIPKNRSVGLNATVAKASSGALEYMKIAKVTNLTATLKELKDNGLWIYAADMDGSDYTKTDLSGPIALVLGGEGSGVSRLVKENCDGVLSLPMYGSVNSLNVSVAGAILMYKAVDDRNKK